MNYQKITISSGDNEFSIFCRQESLELRRDEVIRWADSLARRLNWRSYETTIDTATKAEATAREYALFENRFPLKK